MTNDREKTPKVQKMTKNEAVTEVSDTEHLFDAPVLLLELCHLLKRFGGNEDCGRVVIMLTRAPFVGVADVSLFEPPPKALRRLLW